MNDAFDGAKAAVFIGEQLLLYRRDSHVRWADMWDMPGGGREGNETPRACLAREVFEEFGLDLGDSTELWAADFPAMQSQTMQAWFFVMQFPASAAAKIRFGNEGQYWRLFPMDEVMALPDLVGPLRERLIHWLRHVGNTDA